MPSISALSEAHLPTIEEIMQHRNPFEIIDSPWGRIECWRASTLATGTMGALTQVYEIVRNDAAELQEKTVAFDAKKASVLRTVNKLLNFMSRVDALTSRVEALEAKRKADEERQREFEEPIEEPPGTEEPQADDTHVPGGELHALVPEPALELEGDEAEFELPEPQDPTGTVIPQPTAISLNEE
jgi:hypothetical protein